MNCRGSLCAPVVLAAVLAMSPEAAGQSPTPSPTPVPTPAPVTEEIVVSATKVAEEEIEIAGSTSVVTGDEVRRTGAKTVADALQNVVGLDTGDGSDSGTRLPNIGVWGLKEFDALLVTVDGVPVGGPFNPSLSQIPVEDLERIEIVRGPQGTLYGVSAFAGMIQVFTRRGAAAGKAAGSVTGGGGSFSQWNGALNWGSEVAPGLSVGLFGAMSRAEGWQDRTDWANDRIALSARKTWSDGTFVDTTLGYFRFTNLFGSPVPVEDGEIVPGFSIDRNYAIQGARLDHHVLSLTSNLTVPISSSLRFQNTFGFAQDTQTTARSFVNGVDGLEATADGSYLKPIETTVFDDARMVAEFQAAGHHQLVGGAAITWGRTTAEGFGFDFDVILTPDPIVPSISDVPVGDNRSFNDRRTFFGAYANDEWTPVPWLTVTAGLRLDATSETLHVQQQEVGDPEQDVADDEDSQTKVTGGGAVLFRIVRDPVGPLSNLNLYVSASDQLQAGRPEPLRGGGGARSWSRRRPRPRRRESRRGGATARSALDFTAFHMIFNNLVVAIPSPDGEPILTNAGEERFQGAEVALRWMPSALPGPLARRRLRAPRRALRRASPSSPPTASCASWTASAWSSCRATSGTSR